MSELSLIFSVPKSVRSSSLRGAGLAGTAAVLLLLTACGRQGGTAAAGTGGMPAMEVGVVTVQAQDVGLVNELPGRLEASRVAEVRARVPGILVNKVFREGSDIKAGQTLFRIDPAPYEAALANAQAQQARAEAQLQQAHVALERYRPLVKEKAVSELDWVNAESAWKQAQAEVQAAQAAVLTARIQRGYAEVTAPISGRVGRALVTEGALVGQGDATALAVVQQIDPLYVNFTQSASEAMRLAKAIESGRYKRSGQGAVVKVQLDDGSEHPQAGKLLFSDLTVDGGSGQVTLRAEVPNPGGRLLPGLYVRVRLEQAQAQAVLLPQQAVARLPEGDSVMVVKDGKATQRAVKVGGQQNGQWVVLEGLQPGEQVMADGFQKMMFGAPLKAVPWQAPKGSAAAEQLPGSAGKTAR